MSVTHIQCWFLTCVATYRLFWCSQCAYVADYPGLHIATNQMCWTSWYPRTQYPVPRTQNPEPTTQYPVLHYPLPASIKVTSAAATTTTSTSANVTVLQVPQCPDVLGPPRPVLAQSRGLVGRWARVHLRICALSHPPYTIHPPCAPTMHTH